MRGLELWRTARFRLSLLYGAIFAVGIIALLGMIYWQTAGFMSGQMDQIIRGEADALARAPIAALPDRIREDMSLDIRHINFYGLFSADGVLITGNIDHLPADMKIDGRPRELSPQDGLQPGARALARRLPWGEILIVGRDSTQLAEIRSIIIHALLWSGALIVVLGLLLGGALSIRPLAHVRAIEDTSRRIMDGDLAARLPIVSRRDELDRLAAVVNLMLDEIQRLVTEVKGASDSLAHDLRTPLTRLRALLYQMEQQPRISRSLRDMTEQAVRETDILLGRFRALLRVSEIESRERRAGFAPVALRQVLEQIAELYEPLAIHSGVTLDFEILDDGHVQADPELIFEALSNLIDNAIKFTPPGGQVLMRLTNTADGPRLDIIDSGPGVAAEERTAVLQRFYRNPRDLALPGSGLGLSIVAAIMRLHGFQLELSDADPGLRISIDCWPSWAS